MYCKSDGDRRRFLQTQVRVPSLATTGFFSQKGGFRAMGIADWFSNAYARILLYTRMASIKTLLTVTLSSAITAGLLLSVQASQRKLHRKQLRDSIESKFPGSSRSSVRSSLEYDDIDNDDEDGEVVDFTASRRTKEKANGITGSKDLQASINGNNSKGGRKASRVIDEEIIEEQLARNIAFIGKEAQDRIRNSFVIVVGIGGVGSAAGEQGRVLHFPCMSVVLC